MISYVDSCPIRHLRVADEEFSVKHIFPGRWHEVGVDSSSCKCDTAGDSNKASNRSTLDSLAELLRQRERATIGGLELGELLGRGSFGRVYKGD